MRGVTSAAWGERGQRDFLHFLFPPPLCGPSPSLEMAQDAKARSTEACPGGDQAAGSLGPRRDISRCDEVPRRPGDASRLLSRISYCTADKMHDKVFAYIAQSQQNESLECHAFLCTKRKVVSVRARPRGDSNRDLTAPHPPQEEIPGDLKWA